MILTPAQEREIQKALAGCNEVLSKLDYLQQIAEACPHIKERVDELVTKRDYLQTMCETALAANRAAGA